MENTMSLTVKDRLIKELDTLSEPQLEKLLSSVDRIRREQPVPLSGREFVRRFSGMLPEDQVIAMEKAIEEACERIDDD
jgi:hypothetical protein